MSSEFLYSITPVEKHDNGNKYLINVEVPLDRYWYDMSCPYIRYGEPLLPAATCFLTCCHNAAILRIGCNRHSNEYQSS